MRLLPILFIQERSRTLFKKTGPRHLKRPSGKNFQMDYIEDTIARKDPPDISIHQIINQNKAGKEILHSLAHKLHIKEFEVLTASVKLKMSLLFFLQVTNPIPTLLGDAAASGQAGLAGRSARSVQAMAEYRR